MEALRSSAWVVLVAVVLVTGVIPFGTVENLEREAPFLNDALKDQVV